MNINTNSWHYKFYSWTYDFTERDVPEETNLCQYTKRIIFTLPIIALGAILIVVCAIAMLAFMICSTIPALILGFYPVFIFWKGDNVDIFRSYKGYMFKGFELHPYHLLVPITLILCDYAWFTHAQLIYPLTTHGVVFGTLFFMFTYLWLSDTESESVKLMKAHLSAKKKLICPVVTFSNQSTSTNVEE